MEKKVTTKGNDDVTKLAHLKWCGKLCRTARASEGRLKKKRKSRKLPCGVAWRCMTATEASPVVPISRRFNAFLPARLVAVTHRAPPMILAGEASGHTGLHMHGTLDSACRDGVWLLGRGRAAWRLASLTLKRGCNHA